MKAHREKGCAAAFEPSVPCPACGAPAELRGA
jgi:hypothetical protein